MARRERDTKKPSANEAAAIEARYPSIAAWVEDGWIEVGRDDYSHSFVRAPGRTDARRSEETPVRPYTVLLIPDNEDGGYVVKVPTLPGCVTQGETFEEAIENAKDVLEVWIEAALAAGEAVPEEVAPPQLVTVAVKVVEVAPVIS